MNQRYKRPWSIHVDQDQALWGQEGQSALVNWMNEVRQRTKALISHAHLELPVAIWNDCNRLELVMNNIDYVWYSKVWYDLSYTILESHGLHFFSLTRLEYVFKIFINAQQKIAVVQ